MFALDRRTPEEPLRLSDENRTLIAGAALLALHALEVRLGFRLFPFALAWPAAALCLWPVASGAIRRAAWGPERVLTLAAALFALAGHPFAAGVLALVFRLALALRDRAAALRREAGLDPGLLPQAARLVDRDRQSFVPLDTLRPGDVIRVLPGEIVPVDGRVRSGPAGVSAALPEGIVPGRSVPSGTPALSGPFSLTVEASAFDSTAQRLLRLREESVTRAQARGDRWSGAAGALALAAGVLTWLFTGEVSCAAAAVAAGALAVPGTYALAVSGGGVRGLRLRQETE